MLEIGTRMRLKNVELDDKIVKGSIQIHSIIMLQKHNLYEVYRYLEGSMQINSILILLKLN